MKRILTLAMILMATPAAADTISGVGNTDTHNDNSSTNSSYNSTVGSYNTTGSYNHTSQKQHQSQQQDQVSVNVNSTDSYAKSSVRGSGNSDVNVEAQRRNPVSTAYAAPLVASDDTCSGSTSVGGQAVGFGASFGSTWQDKDCVRRKDARELHNMGQRGASIALMCQNDNVAAAMETAGTPCAQTMKQVKAERIASYDTAASDSYPGKR